MSLLCFFLCLLCLWAIPKKLPYYTFQIWLLCSWISLLCSLNTTYVSLPPRLLLWGVVSRRVRRTLPLPRQLGQWLGRKATEYWDSRPFRQFYSVRYMYLIAKVLTSTRMIARGRAAGWLSHVSTEYMGHARTDYSYNTLWFFWHYS